VRGKDIAGIHVREKPSNFSSEEFGPKIMRVNLLQREKASRPVAVTVSGMRISGTAVSPKPSRMRRRELAPNRTVVRQRQPEKAVEPSDSSEFGRKIETRSH
jgi:hypothetical protein